MSTTTILVDPTYNQYSMPPYAVGEIIGLCLGTILGLFFLILGMGFLAKFLIQDYEEVREGPAVELSLQRMDKKKAHRLAIAAKSTTLSRIAEINSSGDV